MVAVWITTPETNAASGVGERAPLVVIASVLLVVAGAACLGASVLSGRPDQVQNRGQVLAGFGAIASDRGDRHRGSPP